jgi:hypothetical protein
MLDAPQLITVLIWTTVVLGGSLVSCLVWFAIRIVAQLDRIEKDVPGQISALKELVVGEIHKMDLRVASLEAWRDSQRALLK